ncbi:hypothetical protein [Paractinoplanes hotanensis]|uniref:LysM domain-containing protein n=1 Tax=Paractinoplanes hotanensis TaxID=2906497 RepID=A0ABT0YDW7_9ACTN|nr:hypothetical protein [Actinoplanes hotanensis]MCM4084251.1 hypothetical protein [Actinoplanes hotanensis]
MPGDPRYYVVGPPRNGQPEYLYQIAAQTLGDGNRFREIFELNRGRGQPDGGRLTDPLALRPGWILELPAGARGPGVRSGIPPFPAGPSSPPARSAAGAGQAGGHAPYLLGAAGLVLMALLLAAALRLLRPRWRSRPESAAFTTVPIQPRSAAPGPSPAPVPVLFPAAPALPRHGRVAVSLTSLDDDADLIHVRLLVPAAEDAAIPYGWLDAHEAPAGRLPLILGRQGPWRFWLDVAAAPDLFTVTGSPMAARRQTVGIVRRLLAAGAAVTVVGDVLGPQIPPGCRQIDDLPAVEGFGPSSEPGVIVSGPLRDAQLTAARALTGRTASRVVPMLVGDVLRARWSMLATVEGDRPSTVPVP